MAWSFGLAIVSIQSTFLGEKDYRESIIEDVPLSIFSSLSFTRKRGWVLVCSDQACTGSDSQ